MLRRRDIRDGDKKKDSFVQNLELQRGLSLVSPGGFLFRFNKDNRLTQLQGNTSKITLQGKRIAGQKDGEFFRNKVNQDVSSIIQQSISERRTLAVTSASKLKELRIEGAKTFLLKAQENPRNERLDAISVNFENRRDKVSLSLPPLAKYKAPDESPNGKRITELKDSSLSLACNQILPWKPDVSDENKFQIKALMEKDRALEKTKNADQSFIRHESDDIIVISERKSHKKRMINVFLPAISTEELGIDDS